MTPLFGRAPQIAALNALLRDPETRLITLVGPGGVGKTRLALAVAACAADAFADGTVVVPLANIRAPRLVGASIAQALGVRDGGDQSVVPSLVRALRSRELLLVVDNLEHLLAATPLIADLLASCPGLTVLATSRAVLRISGERLFLVSPLELPPAKGAEVVQAAQAPAVQLFVDRARAVQPGFALNSENVAPVATICRNLDGLPLAIELAAARTGVLPPAALLARLDRRLPLLTGGPRDAPPRLRSLRDAIAWSYDLLTEEERALFRRLAVFVGGFTLEAAEWVMGDGLWVMGSRPGGESACRQEEPEPDTHHPSPPSTLDLISTLVASSLLRQEEGPRGEPRFTMLETIREFGLELLAEEEMAGACTAHTAYFLALGERAEPNRLGPGERFDERLHAIEAEHANFRVVLARLADTGDAERLLQLAGGLAVLWHHRAHLREGRQWLERALAQTADEPTFFRGRALAGLALIVWSQGAYTEALPVAWRAHEVAGSIADPYLVPLSIHLLALIASSLGQRDDAEALMEDARDRWRAFGSPTDEGMALTTLSGLAHARGDVDLAERHANRALGLFQQSGHPQGAAMALCALARFARDRGDDCQAAAANREALQLCAGIGERWSIAQPLAGLGEIASRHGRADAAATIIGAIDALGQDVGAAAFPTATSNYDRASANARFAMGEERFGRSRSAGMRLRLEEAVALAAAITSPSPSPGLTIREQEVLRLLARRQTDREIADALFLSRRTVNTHVSRILAKLDARTRRDATERAISLGLLAEDDLATP